MLHMLRKTIFSLAVAVVTLGSQNLFGFALDGPAIGYEVPAWGYEPNTLARGYPRAIGDESRVTTPNIYYACDQTFLDYFGERGRQEVGKVAEYFNELPAFSSMSPDLLEFPMVTYRENYKADALLLNDLKSNLMTYILWDLGLTSPEWYMWSVRTRDLISPRICPFYDWVITMRNFDPGSWEPSSYVNGALYTYRWVLSCPPGADLTYPAPVLVDPTSFGFSAVAGLTSTDTGQYYSGFSRDDIGALRYIYRKQNYNFESLPANVLAGAAGGGTIWSIVDPNATNGAAADTSGLRAGIDKFNFQERPYDSLLSQFFVGFTNQLNSTLITNGTAIAQTFGRPVLVPDMVFRATDFLGTASSGLGRPTPYYSNVGASGPGTLAVGGGVPLSYSLTKIGRAFDVDNPLYLDEQQIIPIPAYRWASYDGTTNEPVFYPTRASIEDLEDLVLSQ